jgi:hypothetical protein
MMKNGDVPATLLTKRELFAAMAMQGLLSGPEFSNADAHQSRQVAMCAVNQADALLAGLEPKP